jgi:hypothetical protein
MDAMRFELKLKEIPVMLVTVDGVDRPCFLRELQGDGRDQFMDNVGRRTIPGVNNKLNDFKDHQAVLIAKCLFEEGGSLVPLSEIRAFPAQVQKDLFMACRDLSGLNTEEEVDKDAEKNE